MNQLVPVHITDLAVGTPVKASLKSGPHKHTTTGAACVRNNNSVIGNIAYNTPSSGMLAINTVDSSGKSFQVEISYSCIFILYKLVPNSEIVQTATNPGGVALGTVRIDGRFNSTRHRLIPVRF